MLLSTRNASNIDESATDRKAIAELARNRFDIYDINGDTKF